MKNSNKPVDNPDDYPDDNPSPMVYTTDYSTDDSPNDNQMCNTKWTNPRLQSRCKVDDKSNISLVL
jgi:hypothetical protein